MCSGLQITASCSHVQFQYRSQCSAQNSSYIAIVVKQKLEGTTSLYKKTTNKLYIESYCQASHIKGKNTVVSVALTKKILAKKISLRILKINLSSYRCVWGVCVYEAERSSQTVKRRRVLQENPAAPAAQGPSSLQGEHPLPTSSGRTRPQQRQLYLHLSGVGRVFY